MASPSHADHTDVGEARKKARGAISDLTGEVVVISPHLDDAVLSLGATIARAASRGTAIRVVTVFAGDPESTAAAEPWDAFCGFRLAGEAAAARRAEDRTACSIVGALPVWLPFVTQEHVRHREADVVEAIRRAIADATIVLIPGSPLTLPEHAFCTGVALRAVPPTARLGLYVEQPYAVWEVVGSRARVRRFGFRLAQAARSEFARTRQAPRSPLERDAAELPLRWKPQRTHAEDRAAKRQAIRAYRSQLRKLGLGLIWQIALYEWSWGGESVTWLDGARGNSGVGPSIRDHSVVAAPPTSPSRSSG